MTAEADDRLGLDSGRGSDVVSTWARSRPGLPRLNRMTFRQRLLAALLISVGIVDVTRGFTLVAHTVSNMQQDSQPTTIRRVAAVPASTRHENAASVKRQH